MTAITAPSVSKVHEMPEKKSQQESRRATDEHGFLALALLTSFYILICICHKTITTIGSPAVENDTWDNDFYINSSREAISNAFRSVHSAIRALRNDDLFKNSYIWITVGSLTALYWAGTFFLFIRLTLVKLFFDICRMMSDSEYMHHYTVINIGRAIITQFFFKLLYIQWPDVPNQFIGTLTLIEFAFLLSNLQWLVYSWVESGMKIKSVLRFYFLRRNLILFQFLNFMIMLLLTACLVVILKFFCGEDLITYQIALTGGFFLIATMHIYAKMVIMLATASYNWNIDGGGVSWKLIGSSMITISKYHLGSVIYHSPILEWIHYFNRGKTRTLFMKEEVYTPFDPTIARECSKILTAVHGQDICKAGHTLRHPEIKSRINHNFKSKTLIVWTVMMYILSSLIIVIIPWYSVSTAKELLSLVIISTSLFLLNGIYYYAFISPVNTIELTIELCKTVKKVDLEIIALDNFETDELKQVEDEGRKIGEDPLRLIP